MIVVETMPNPILPGSVLVVRTNTCSRTPVKALNPSSRNSIPNRNIDTPAAISLKLGLIQKP